MFRRLTRKINVFAVCCLLIITLTLIYETIYNEPDPAAPELSISAAAAGFKSSIMSRSLNEAIKLFPEATPRTDSWDERQTEVLGGGGQDNDPTVGLPDVGQPEDDRKAASADAAFVCTNLRRPVTPSDDGKVVLMRGKVPDQWQVIQNDASYAFSAHRDPRYGDRVRIRLFGIMRANVIRDPVQSRLYCQLWSRFRLESVVQGELHSLGLDKNYNGFELTCDFPEQANVTWSSFVTLTKSPCVRSSNAFRVNDNSWVKEAFQKFAICLTDAIDHDFSGHRRLVEWMELAAILGARRANVYVSSTSPTTDRLLAYYRANGKLNTIPWGQADGELAHAAGFVLANDCLYRNLRKTAYVVMTGLGQTLAPLRPEHRSWDGIVCCACCQNNSYMAPAVAQFDINQPDDNHLNDINLDVQKAGLITLLKTRRFQTLLPPRVGPSGIMKTQMIERLSQNGVTFVYNLPLRPCFLPECIAQLYDYDRVTFSAGEPLVVDRRLEKFGSQLVAAVAAVHRELADSSWQPHDN